MPPRRKPLPAVPTSPGPTTPTKPAPAPTQTPLHITWTGGAPQKTTVRTLPHFDPAHYFAQDLTIASSSLPTTSEADHQQ